MKNRKKENFAGKWSANGNIDEEFSFDGRCAAQI
jgi:hypothetical protein